MRLTSAIALAFAFGCSTSGAGDDDASNAGSGGTTVVGAGRGGALSGASGTAGTALGGNGGTVAGSAGRPALGGAGGGAGDAATGGAGSSSGGSAAGTAGASAAGASGTVANGGAGGAQAGAGGTSDGGSASGVGGAGAGRAGAGAAGMAGVSGDDRCNVAVYDASKPPGVLNVTGNLGTHDPALIEVDGTYYLYATGRGLGAKTSKDLTAWSGASAVFSSNPAWIKTEVPKASDLWAPDISYFGGQYHLYYAASSFGSNMSCIGHATRDSLASGSFTDHGSVICSNASGSSDNWNAIDPNIALDADGTPWMSFGSFWSGIKLVKLKTDGTRDGTDLASIANRPQNSGALEGPFIVRRCGYYYLFVSFGACCDTPWDYNMRVGRSTTLAGPYVDKAGTAMTQGGGTLLVQGNSTWTAPGHNAVIFSGDRAYNVYHALNSSHTNPVLRVAEIAWDSDGWPISGGP